MKNKIKVPVLMGPTAVGKTDISVELARDLDLEIISCDSRQIYRHLDIGTAKVSQREMAGIKHWMLNIIDPKEPFSAFQYANTVLDILRTGAKKGKKFLICGGTGLYFKSLSEGLGAQISTDYVFRDKYMEEAQKKGAQFIHDELRSCDPVSADRLHPNDVQRVIRALQVFYDTGRSIFEHHNDNQKPGGIDFSVIKLTMARPELYDRINKRVDLMVKNGLWQEFISLLDRGYCASDPGMQCVGYKELFPVLEGGIELKDAFDTIKRNSRRYAKRQITWFTNKVDGFSVDTKIPTLRTFLKEKINHLWI